MEYFIMAFIWVMLARKYGVNNVFEAVVFATVLFILITGIFQSL